MFHRKPPAQAHPQDHLHHGRGGIVDLLMLALARKIVAGEEDAAPVGVEGDGRHEHADDRQRTLFSWAEFMAGEPDEPPKPRRRDEAPTLSLFEWALEQEQEGALSVPAWAPFVVNGGYRPTR